MEPIKWKSISDIPRTIEEGYGDPEDLDNIKVYLRRGTVLRKPDGTLTLIGNDLSGVRTKGCSCCSTDWAYALQNYSHYLEPEEVIPDWLLEAKL